jgi:hypothetical protein
LTNKTSINFYSQFKHTKLKNILQHCGTTTLTKPTERELSLDNDKSRKKVGKKDIELITGYQKD